MCFARSEMDCNYFGCQYRGECKQWKENQEQDIINKVGKHEKQTNCADGSN